jgi:hypothetical protein
VNAGICSPKRRASGSPRWRAAAAGAATKAGGTISTSPASCTPSNPSSASTASAVSKARCWLVTTFDGRGG